MAVASYMVDVYAYLVKQGRRDFDTLPTEYQLPVAQKLALEADADPAFYSYMVKPYAYLVTQGVRTIESLPTQYQGSVSDHLAAGAETA